MIKKNFQFKIFNFQRDLPRTKLRFRSGFSLVEMLIGIAIIGIAVTIVTLSFSKLNENKALDTSTSLVISVLNEARSLTLSSKNSSQYGVSLQESQVVLFQGVSYATSTPTNEVSALNSLVVLRNINLTGSSTSVVFKRLTGTTSQSGTLEVYLKDNPANYRTISVSATGVVEEN